MIDTIKGLVGKEAALGLLAFAGTAWLAAGPIGERVAVRDHLPRCIAGLAEVAGDPQQDFAQELLGQLPGELGDLTRAIVNGAERLAESRRRKAAEAAARAAPDRCHCRMRLALGMTRMDFTLWVGTLKVYQPASVRDFGSVMATVDRNGVCEASS